MATIKGDQLAKPWQLFVNFKSEGNEEQKPDLQAEKNPQVFHSLLLYYRVVASESRPVWLESPLERLIVNILRLGRPKHFRMGTVRKI